MTNIEKNSEYSVAIVGLGRIGLQMELDEKRVKPATHFGSYCHNPRISKLFLIDNDSETLDKARNAAEKLGVTKPIEFISDYSELHRIKPDILVVATNPESHREILVFGVPFVKAIICEKPIATNVVDAEYMVDICEKYGVLLVMDYCRRFLPVIWQCKEMIESGVIGEVRHMSGLYTAGIMNSGSHLIDMLRCLNGNIKKINCSEKTGYSCPDGDVNLNAILTFDNGSYGFLQSSEAKDYAIFDINVYGSKGMISISNFGFVATIKNAETCKTFGGYKELSETKVIDNNSKVSMWGNLASHVIECLDSGLKISDKSSGADGFESVKLVLELINRSEH